MIKYYKNNLLISNNELQYETNWIPLEIMHKYLEDFRLDNIVVKFKLRIGYYSSDIEITNKKYI